MKSIQISIISKLFAFIVFMSLSNSVWAQDPETTEDDKVYDEEVKEDDDDDDDFEIHIHNHRHHFYSDFRFSMLDLGVSSYLYNDNFNLPNELEDFELLYGGSANINWHLFRHRLPIAKRNVGLEYGLTISWMQYKFAHDKLIAEDTTSFTFFDTGVNYNKNKLKTTFLEVPIMLTISPWKRKSFFISAGVYGGVLIGSKQKLKDEDGNKKRRKDDFNLNKFRYGVEGRLGLGPVSFYVQYSLQNLFKDGQGPELTPINIGVTLLSF